MSRKAIREFDGKRLLAQWLKTNSGRCLCQLKSNHTDRCLDVFKSLLYLSCTGFTDFVPTEFVQVKSGADYDQLARQNPWVLQKKLVAKPDQLIKRRGKAGLIKLNATWNESKAWIEQRMNKEVQVNSNMAAVVGSS